MKNKIFLTVAAICLSLMAAAQPYAVGKATRNYIDQSRSSRSINVELYYPAQSAGTNTAVASGSFGTITVGHGFVMGVDAYYHLRDTLVPMGYVVALVNMEGGLSPSHGSFGQDMAFVAQALADENTQNSSIFYAKLNDKKVLLGHSMGGGSGILASTQNANINGYIGFAPAETNPSAIAAASGMSCPTLIFAGSADCVSPPAANQLPMYNAAKVGSSCATYIALQGASHCKFAYNNVACNFGESNCQGTITREVQHQRMFKYLKPFLDYTLNGSLGSLALFKNNLTTDPNISYEQQCSAQAEQNIREKMSVSIQKISDGQYKISVQEPVMLSVFDVLGNKITQKNTYKNSWELNKQDFGGADAFYFVQLKNARNEIIFFKLN